ncbi:MAG: hypothetical protein ACYCXB_07235 [Candidatus Humimicrobiaceae bacterium]
MNRTSLVYIVGKIEDMVPGGGFIFTPVHIIQGSVLPQKLMAW